MGFRAFRVVLRHTFFFENFREREAQNARESSDWLIDWFLILYTEGIQLSCSFRWSMFRPHLRGSAAYIVYVTALEPINPKDIILTSLVPVHAGYLFCYWHPLNANYYGTTFGGMPGFVGIGVLGLWFIVSSEGLGLHKMLPPRGFEPASSACQVSLGHG